MPSDDHLHANLRNWNERASIHARSNMYDLEGFVADPSRLWLHPSERGELGDVQGRTLCQLQCHLGLETLSWARLGASRTVGLDFSGNALDIARGVAQRCGLSERVSFVESDVYEAPQALAAHAPFDIVYVSVGAICWLPSITRWAAVVSSLLKPGGTFYMREVHPMLAALSERDGKLVIDGPYFERAEPVNWNTEISYTDGSPKLQHAACYEWAHGIGEVVQALLDAGLTLELLQEQRDVEFPALPMMIEDPEFTYRLPPALRDNVPLTYSLRARKHG
ncbi:MAG: class I SAM-dependent methyltransferase [Polyangiales bacterium]